MQRARLSILAATCALAVSGCFRVAGYPERAADSELGRDHPSDPGFTPTSSPGAAEKTNPIDPARAFNYLKAICDLGPRVSGSPGMTRQQELLVKHFEQLGGKVKRQEFTIRHPRTGQPTKITNLIVEWHPDRKQRVLLAAHYDTRPFPDADPSPLKRTTGTFIGANDGGSGTALLMELAHFMPGLKGNVGVDFVLLDAEELVYDGQRDRYFIGSEYFAREYVANPPDHRYRWGVLVDMIGDKKLAIYQEKNSAWWNDTKPLVDDIWATARRLGVREFIAKRKYEIRDDHLMLRNVGKIPTCNIIDFEYPVEHDQKPGGKYWHTEADTPDKCSGESLAKVGWVLLEWLESVR